MEPGDQITLSVPSYNPAIGVVAPVEGGFVLVETTDEGVRIAGDPASLRDLARWCLSMSDPAAFSGVHVHLAAGAMPLTVGSLPLLLERDDSVAE